MSTVTDLDVEKILQMLKGKGYVIKHSSEAGSGSGKRGILEEKFFRRMEGFEGKEGKWQEWIFNLLVCVGQVEAECVLAMEEMLKETLSLTTLNETKDKVGEERFGKYSSELFGVLCSLTSGEANVIVRSVVGKGFGFCGFSALSFLNNRYNPKTPARLLQCLTEVISPGVVKDIRNLPKTVENWEARKNRLKLEFKEDLSDNLAVAILVSMIPRDFQDMVFQMGGVGDKLKYQEVRDKILSVAGHRAQLSQPTPMDISAMDWNGKGPSCHGEGCEEMWGEVQYPWGEGGEGTYDIDAMGKGGNAQCHRCGGFGHFARECGTPADKGKGKGGKGEQLGKGKGDWGKGLYGKSYWPEAGGKGSWGKEGKGKGKGYQGTCYQCGQVGHKAAECATKGKGKGVRAVEAEGHIQSVEMGGVWMLGCVGKRMDAGTGDFQVVKTRNRFNKARKMRAEPNSGAKYFRLDDDEVEICAIDEKKKKTKITIDSAAEESACPWEWGEGFGIQEVEEGKGMKLVNASGGGIQHWGAREVRFTAEDVGKVRRLMGLGFQVCDVKKPLAAVWRICEKGNLVQFGPEDEDCFIQSKKSGDKVLLRRERGSYVLDVEFDGVF